MSIIPILFGRLTTSLWDDLDDFNRLQGPHFDWDETSDTVHFYVDLPGLRKEEVKVEVREEKVLRISGGRETDGTAAVFVHSFRLPEEAKVDKARAVMKDALLTVSVPKEKGWTVGKRVIKIQGD